MMPESATTNNRSILPQPLGGSSVSNPGRSGGAELVEVSAALVDSAPPLPGEFDELDELEPGAESEAETVVMPVAVAVEPADPPPHEAASRTAVALMRKRVIAA